MELSTILIITAIVLIIAAGAGYLYFKQRNTQKLFQEARNMASQVPKQKKNGFLLLMFKEALSASKDKNKQSALSAKFNNPKYLNLQLIQMNRAIKNPENISDKKMKNALKLLSQYQRWEKGQNNALKNKSEAKAS